MELFSVLRAACPIDKYDTLPAVLPQSFLHPGGLTGHLPRQTTKRQFELCKRPPLVYNDKVLFLVPPRGSSGL
jgi:hypothetical protein